MQVRCYSKIGEEAAKTYEAEAYEAHTVTPFSHEVIITVDGKQRLLQVDGRAREATSPERYAQIDVLHDGKVVWHGGIDGSAVIHKFILPANPDDIASEGLIGYTDEQLRDVLVQRKVKFSKKASSDALLALVTHSGGLPTAEELGIEVTEEEVEADEDDGA